MIKQNCLAIYKNKSALVTDVSEKITIKLSDGTEIKVREKDILVLHNGPLKSLKELENIPLKTPLDEVWELSLSMAEEGDTVSLKDLAELAWNDWTPQTAWNAYNLLTDGLYFSGSTDKIISKSKEQIEAETNKRNAKENETIKRTAFLDRLKTSKLNLPDDERFLQDVQALALGKTEKSRTMHDAGLPEDCVAAHKLLLTAGVWPANFNPYPSRFDVSLNSSKVGIKPCPDEERLDLRNLESFAVDAPGSLDPDDAVSITNDADGCTVYVHVADPAASVQPDSDADIEARSRGTTFYAPEGASRMLCEDALRLFALGLTATSPALTFIIKIGTDGTIKNTEIVRSIVQVTRLSYEEADTDDRFKSFFDFADQNIKRRASAGATFIDFPEVHINVKDGVVSITPQKEYRSTIAIRECMLLAGEAAAGWALKRHLPFPFVSQETGDLPENPMTGLAGAYQLRRCMRPRTLSCQPGLHWGLGLDIYTQVTSPLRRYTDLLAHQQIRAFLAGASPIENDELAARLAQSGRGAVARAHAERASKAFWMAVYLQDKIDSIWDAIYLDRKGPQAVLFVPLLGTEIQTALPHSQACSAPNDTVKIKLKRVNLAESEIHFVLAS